MVDKTVIKMRNKDPLRLVEILVIIISLLLSISAFFVSISSNNKSNQIAENQLIIDQGRLVSDKKERSLSIVNTTYDKIMYTQDLYDMWKIVSDGSLYEGKTKVRLFIDELEGLGDRYCKGQIYREDLQVIDGIFKKTCTHHQIVDIFKGQKNGLSKLCLDKVGTQGMGSFYEDKDFCEILQ